MQSASAVAALQDKFTQLLGQDIHVGPWLEIDQQRIERLGDMASNGSFFPIVFRGDRSRQAANWRRQRQ